MYAVVETGGKQYRVAPGDVVRVEKLAGETGAEIEFGRVLAFAKDDGTMLTGADAAGVKVTGTIQAQDREAKVLVFKFKRKKQYKRTIGHRQAYTAIRVGPIEV